MEFASKGSSIVEISYRLFQLAKTGKWEDLITELETAPPLVMLMEDPGDFENGYIPTMIDISMKSTHATGDILLHIAAREGADNAILEKMIDLGSDITWRNNIGRTCLDEAFNNNKHTTVEFLEQKLAKQRRSNIRTLTRHSSLISLGTNNKARKSVHIQTDSLSDSSSSKSNFANLNQKSQSFHFEWKDDNDSDEEDKKSTLSAFGLSLPKFSDIFRRSQKVEKPKSLGVTICIGDIHGVYNKLVKLWSTLELALDKDDWENANVVWLGDYVDKGLETKKCIEWLATITTKCPPGQKHHFLLGKFMVLSLIEFVSLTRMIMNHYVRR
jgi:hypothetical protein